MTSHLDRPAAICESCWRVWLFRPVSKFGRCHHTSTTWWLTRGGLQHMRLTRAEHRELVELEVRSMRLDP